MRIFSKLLRCCPRCARPRRNARPSEHFLHSSHCTLHTPHSTLHSCTSHSTLHLNGRREQPLVAEHQGGTDSTPKRPQPHPPHTGPTLHHRVQPHYTEKRKDSCSGFLHNTKPMQQSCSHYNAFCSTTYTSMQPLQCDLHPHNAICIHMLQNTKGEPIRPRNDRSRTRRTQDVPFIAGSSHIERKNTWFRAAFSSPKQNGDDSLRDLFVFQSGAVFFAICYILALKSLICVLFAAFWSQNLLFVCYLLRF